MKVEECPESLIQVISEQLKAKPRYADYIHFSNHAYYEQEMLMLVNVGFDLNCTSIYRSLESLVKLIKESKKLDQKTLLMLEQDVLRETAKKVFYDQLIFLYPLGLIAIVIIKKSLEKQNHIIQEFFSNQKQLIQVIQQNADLLLQIENGINEIKWTENNQELTTLLQQLEILKQQKLNKKNPPQNQLFPIPTIKRRDSSHDSIAAQNGNTNHSNNNANSNSNSNNISNGGFVQPMSRQRSANSHSNNSNGAQLNQNSQ